MVCSTFASWLPFTGKFAFACPGWTQMLWQGYILHPAYLFGKRAMHNCYFLHQLLVPNSKNRKSKLVLDIILYWFKTSKSLQEDWTETSIWINAAPKKKWNSLKIQSKQYEHIKNLGFFFFDTMITVLQLLLPLLCQCTKPLICELFSIVLNVACVWPLPVVN